MISYFILTNPEKIAIPSVPIKLYSSTFSIATYLLLANFAVNINSTFLSCIVFKLAIRSFSLIPVF